MSATIEAVGNVLLRTKNNSIGVQAVEVIGTMQTLGWLSPADLEARDQAVRDAALDMAAKVINKRWSEYSAEFGSMDYDTGTVEHPGNGNDMIWEWQELEEAILSLKSNPASFQGVTDECVVKLAQDMADRGCG